MPIRASSTREIASLIADLASVNPVERDAAVARLTIIGPRAVERLVAAATASGGAESRAAAWSALEAIGDARAVEPALAALASPQTPPASAAAAAGVARRFIAGPHGAAIVERLTMVVLDRARPDTVRRAALHALRDLDRRTIAPLMKSLAADPIAADRERGGSSLTIANAAERALGDDPAVLRAAIAKADAQTPPTLLLRIVERVREREGAEPPARRGDWQLVRAAAHQALAERGSRIALYDLRESLERATSPLPAAFLAPLALIGDATCLEAISAAHAHATDAWMRERLAQLFYTIVGRERVTKKRAAAIWAGGAIRARRARTAGKAGR